MHDITKTALAAHAQGAASASEDACIGTALLRPLLHRAVKYGTLYFTSLSLLLDSEALL